MTTGMRADPAAWSSRPRPDRVVLEGRHARLEPLDAMRHGDALFAASMAAGAGERFRYLFDSPMDRASFQGWLERSAASSDPLFWAVIDRATGRAEGRQALMRIDAGHGVIEIGSILWGPAMAGTRVATEAHLLFASHVFSTLGYRRLEWKCDDRNQASKRAALRFGYRFEGLFRQHMVVKGQNRDTAWFAILDRDWPALEARCRAWLDPANFDAAGRQRQPLAAIDPDRVLLNHASAARDQER
jgi:RimJ/RimL family protein N-acetyltransferase